MGGKNWTAAELATLADYGRVPRAELAARLPGRSWPAICLRAELLGRGRTNRHYTRFAAVEGRYRELHAQGYSDEEIARELGCTRGMLHRHRRRLGLPSNRTSERFRAKMREQTARYVAAQGVANFAELRRRRHAEFAAKYGLPADLQLRASQIVLVLLSGPKTKSQICAALGLTWRPGVRGQHCLGAGTKATGHQRGYLSLLRERGLVVAQRIPGTGGKGPTVRGIEQTRYALTPVALTLLTTPKETRP